MYWKQSETIYYQYNLVQLTAVVDYLEEDYLCLLQPNVWLLNILIQLYSTSSLYMSSDNNVSLWNNKTPTEG